MSKHGLLSYQYEEFMKYKQANNILPQHLVSYCSQEIAKDVYPDVSVFAEQLNNIISSITKGDDPNNLILRNFIKFYVNMIHQGNYEEYLEKLQKLNYTSKDNMHFLLTELVICASSYAISVKGFSFQEDNKHKSVPEICADIAKQFTKRIEIVEDKQFSFHDELMKICQQFFLDFVDLNKSLDENNKHTTENYFGFMTVMGLLYSRGIIGNRIVVDCLDMIKRSIFCSSNLPKQQKSHNCEVACAKLMGYKKNIDNKLAKCICFYDCELSPPTEENLLETHRKAIECSNLYKGYEHLLSHVINSLGKVGDAIVNLESCLATLEHTNESSPEYENIAAQYKSAKSTVEKYGDFVSTLIKTHQHMIDLNKFYRSLNKTQLIAPFKTPILLSHNNTGSKLNKIKDSLQPFCSQQLLTYENVSIGKLKV
jgi:hypothetical protein